LGKFSVITLYQHYFPANGEQLLGEEWGDGGESYEIESYKVESGANKKGNKKRELQRFLFKALSY